MDLKKLSSKRLLTIVTIIVVVIIAIVAIVATKFSQKNKTTPTSQTSTNPVYIGCPVDQTLCGNSIVVKTPQVTKTTTTLLGWKVPKYSQVFAVFDGKIKEEITPVSSTSAIYIVTITSLNGKYQAHYMFLSFRLGKESKTTATPEKDVKAKEIIGPILADNLGGLFNDQDVNLLFSVSFTNGVPIDIKPPSVGRIVLP